MNIEVASSEAMQDLGAKIGACIAGGESIELVGDIGAGKTTFTKGFARALGITEDIQSPTFTINNQYDTPNGQVLAHYDFYRLSEPGVMRSELAEALSDSQTVTVLEWGDVVADVLPDDTLRISIVPTAEDTRVANLTAGGPRSRRILEQLV